MSWVVLLLLPFLASAVAALMPTRARNAASSWAALVALAVLVQVALLFAEVRDGGVVEERIAWLPGVSIGVRIDGFAWMFALLIAGIVLSGNLVQLVLFWELTSLFSCLLIGYWQHRSDARRGARMALTVTGAGGLALFARVLLRLVLTVGRDLIVSNVAVARGVLRSRGRRAAFVVVPLELRDRHGLAALAVITTVVPGFVSSAALVKFLLRGEVIE